MKQTTAQAAYWHDWVQHLPPAPPPPTAEEIAEQERKAADERAAAALANEARMFWGGRLPSDQVRRAGASGSPLVRFDRALAEEIAATRTGTQRAIARWVARRAYDVAGLSTVAWIAPALDALDHGDPLPGPFDDTALAFRRLLVDPAVPQTVVTAPEGGPRNRSQQAAAFPAIWGAAEPDPLRAAYDALAAAIVAYGDRYPDLFRDLRRAFFT